jgi:hypothetical protein
MAGTEAATEAADAVVAMRGETAQSLDSSQTPQRPAARPERRASVAQDGVQQVVSEAHKAARESGELGEQARARL